MRGERGAVNRIGFISRRCRASNERRQQQEQERDASSDCESRVQAARQYHDLVYFTPRNKRRGTKRQDRDQYGSPNSTSDLLSCAHDRAAV